MRHGGIASVFALALAVFAAGFWLGAPPAHGQAQDPYAAPAAASPTPTATPIVPPSPPTLTLPAEGELTTGATNPPLGMPTFAWSLPAGANLSHLQVSNTAGFSVLLIDTDTEATSYTPTSVWPDGAYYWRVKAATGNSTKRIWGDYSAVHGFIKNWSSNGEIKPTLLAPPANAVRTTFAVGDFAWTPVAGAAGYLFEIATDAQFAATPYKAETLKAQHTPSVRLPSGPYYWRVTPFAYAGPSDARVYGAPSEAGVFTFNWTAPPALLGPDNGAVTPFTPRFQWQAVEGAQSYQLQVGTDSDFNPTTTYNTANTDFTPTGNLSNDKEYFWRVKAKDQNNNETNWSDVRSFRIQWHFAPKLLTPDNGQTGLSYPFFSWEPVPGAEQYQIQIDDSYQFEGTLIADEKVFNVTNYTQPSWSTIPISSDAVWRVRAIDANGNYTPWSATRSLRTATAVAPDLIYPPHTFTPDSQNLPVHRTTTVAWPLFVWDTAHEWINTGGPYAANVTVGPDYYWLMVDDEPTFAPPVKFSIQTRTLGAAPVLDPANPDHAFGDLQNGVLYYWRVQAIRNGVLLGQDARWQVRFDRTVSELAPSAVIAPMYPRDGYQAVGSPPVLGWQPVVADNQAAANYHVQISRTPDFGMVMDEAYPRFANYVPWQGRSTDMPPGVYYWRVRAESSPDSPIGDWSEPRSFALSLDLLTGNQYDFKPAPYRVPAGSPNSLLTNNPQYVPAMTLVATSTVPAADEFGLDRLHMLIDRTYVVTEANLSRNWNFAIAFNISPSASGKTVRYGLYVDTNHIAATKPCASLGAGESDPGGDSDPIGQGVTSIPLYAPEYALYADWNGSDVASVYLYRWMGPAGGCTWVVDELKSKGGWYWYDPATNAIQLLVPVTLLDAADDDFSGSLALTLFSTGAFPGDTVRSSIPRQGSLPGNAANVIDNPLFVSDMLQPLFPFDTPLANPFYFQDMPPLRWRMPLFDSVDGYQVQVARDERFTKLVAGTPWETYESSTGSFFALIPATFQATEPVADNESYYWRVRIRHEKRDSFGAYDYGPWSPPLRFKLDSRMVGNPRLSTGSDVFMTPTFEWDRVEGAASYRLQVDDDSLFGSPLIDVGLDGTSYTPPETTSLYALSSHVPYYWRVAIRRTDSVQGAWTAPMMLDKNALAPTPVAPLTTDPLTLLNEMPTFVWSPILAPGGTPRLAAPMYKLQVDNSPDFKSPEIDVATTATSYTPTKGRSLADGAWYWRVAMYEATGNPGPFSPPQMFNKQYPLLVPITPHGSSNTDKTPRFSWQPAAGAAYYILEIAQDSGFQNPTKYTTASSTYTPKEARKTGVYYWRVKMVDQDGKEGPILPYRFHLGQACYLPFVNK
jgi:hypothetical protein